MNMILYYDLYYFSIFVLQFYNSQLHFQFYSFVAQRFVSRSNKVQIFKKLILNHKTLISMIYFMSKINY